VILIAPGEYPEWVEIAHDLTLKGEGKVVITGGFLAGLRIRAGEVSLQGLTLEAMLQAEGQATVHAEECQLSSVYVTDGAQMEIVDSLLEGDWLAMVVSGRGSFLRSSDSRFLGGVVVTFGEAVFVDCELGEVTVQLGKLTAQGSRMGAITLQGGSLTLSDCDITGDMTLYPGSEAVLEDCRLAASQIGISLHGDSQVSAEGLTITGGTTGIDLSDISRLELTSSSIYGCESAGINAWDQTSLELSQVKIESAGEYGIFAKGTVNITMEECEITGCGDGLHLAGQVTAQVTGSRFRGNRAYGIAAWGNSRVTGAGNEFSGNGCDLLGDVATGVRQPLSPASEEVITSPDPRFPTLQAALDALLPGGTLVLAASQTGSVVIEKELTIKASNGARLSATSEEVPVISLVPGAKLSLEGIHLHGGAYGVLVPGSASLNVSGGTVTGCGVGFELWAQASLTLQGTEISHCRKGIQLRDGATAALTDVQIHDSAEVGILAWHEASLTLEGSLISGNGKGVVLYLRGCGFGWAPEEFAGTLAGAGNRIFGNQELDLCPPYPGTPWPDGFLLPAP
jgi:nitrous oxidase accessory protein NosD